MIRKIALDLGNGNMKGAEVRGETVATCSLPAQVGVGDTNFGALSLGGLGDRRRRESMPVSIVWDGGDYLVGHNVTSYARVLERMDTDKYTDSIEVRALTYAVLAQLFDGGPSDIAAVVALPVDVMMSANSREIIKGIEGWLVGRHEFTYDGRPASITVHAIKAMAQPVGAFFAWGMNNQGEWARPEKDLLHASVAVLDSGFNTLDLLVVKKGKIEKRFTGGETLGVRRAAEEICRAVKAQFGYDMPKAEADTFIRAYLEHGSTDFATSDLRPVVKRALHSLATQTADFIEDTWGSAGQFTHVLLAGGGALVLDGALHRRIPQAVTLPDPVTANVVGLARLAVRAGTFKGLPE